MKADNLIEDALKNAQQLSVKIVKGATFDWTYPVEFAKRCIKIYSNPGDMILEPFLGTGTTMKAAYETGRNCTGYEVLQRMLPIIKNKVNFGAQDLFEEINWEVIDRYAKKETTQ